ncbi:lipase family protein [Paenibacillus lautus]|uniref:lipase family protein n=1 Tax=Paenibacillus lautus TaxID=1401 RepID=UPI003D9A580D
MSSPQVDDETYRLMSEAAYLDLEKEDTVEDLPGWEVLEDYKSNSISGFDAVTFYNKETNQAVIAYRGTEAGRDLSHALPDYLADADIGIEEIKRKIPEFRAPWADHVDKVKEVTGINDVTDWFGEQSRKIDKKTDILGTNQLYQAEDYALEMKEKYKGVDFSLTGHSLGGANAQYAAAYTGMSAVTFSAPSVIGSLSPEARRKAENGEFDSQIINFAHPGDIIASGALGGYDGHVGSTYYIDSSYKDANDGLSIKEKIDNTLGGPNYHQLDRYQFENGYISNRLYDGATGKSVDSPRIPSHSGLLFGLGGPLSNLGLGLGLGGSMGALAGSAGGSSGTIQVTPAELRSVAEKWRAHAHQSEAEMQGIRQRLSKYMFSSHSRRLQPIVQQLDTSIMSMSQWHLQHTTDIVQYIKFKADLFERTDNSG